MKLLILAAAMAMGGTAIAQDMPAAPPAQTTPTPQTPPADAPEAPPAPETPATAEAPVPAPDGPPPAPAPAQAAAVPAPMTAPIPSDPASYPPCSRTVTDHCRQRGGH